ncbi:MAG TPA: DNA ligase [Candidatus Limnocylindria bacterium]|nr:DNA ligase [Candidatus Limnocylindria bacterium]
MRRDTRSPGGEHPTLLDIGDAQAALPRDLVPMRPRLAANAFNSPDHLFELKWDGIRALASMDRGRLSVADRSGGDLLPLVPELADLPVPDGAMLDGEIVVCDSRGRPSYDLLTGRLGPKAAKRGRGPVFVAFDLLYEDRRPLLGRPLEERRRRLTALGIRSRSLAVPEHLGEDGEPFLDVVAEYGLEGIVAKRRDSRYIPGTRSGDWLKCHVTPRSDVVLGGLVEDERRGAVRALCGMYTDDVLSFVGEAYVPPYLGRWLDEATRDFTADVSPFATPLPLRTGMRWLRPRIVAIVEHAGETRELRDARFRALRFDGRLDDCRVDEPIEMESAPARAGSERPRLIVLHSLPFGPE